MCQSDNKFKQFTHSDVKIISKTILFSGFFEVVKYTFQHKLFEGGWSSNVQREMFERGHAAALLPYDPLTDQVVMIEQIRVGALEHDNPWQLEIVAGIIDENESAEDVVKREAFEEAGIAVELVESITSYYPSSGGCSEKLDVFVGLVDASSATGVHGLDYEDEDIRVHVFSRTDAYQMVKERKIENGASIMALQWLELNHEELKSRWVNE
ncbi:ADP-ribose diphosphatase [Vibrio tapetis]|uniref:ADP-ribose pyrophosphatase n=1 Tax=Vibrio tapetis subsp. tapetis TaxID=1671868 RepID=A0A2N8Z8G9_9VIBR|nr:ADP-ribose diphosphatase [Vibrio tapetis]SON48186.1 ADP-ribose pyrophosphatase [Vibrio tapetis subsp. tapetis]